MSHPPKYVAYWLPVPGEITDGDHYMMFTHGMFFHKKKQWVGRKWSLHQKGKETGLLAKLTKLLWDQDIIRVKLFLCSQDIHAGDTYMYFTNDQDYAVERIYHGGPILGHWFKKLKKISPKAVWVEHGDLFTEEDILPWNDLMDFMVDAVHLNDPEPTSPISYIKIFNKSCKHFH